MWHLIARAVALASMGHEKQSRATLAELEQRYGDMAAFQIGGVRPVLGDADEAFASLDRAFERRQNALTLVRSLPWFDSLRADPRYLSLLRRIGLAQPEP